MLKAIKRAGYNAFTSVFVALTTRYFKGVRVSKMRVTADGPEHLSYGRLTGARVIRDTERFPVDVMFLWVDSGFTGGGYQEVSFTDLARDEKGRWVFFGS